MGREVTTEGLAAGRWQARHGAAFALRFGAAAIPVALSIVAACVVARWIGPQELGAIGWVLPGLVALLVVFVTERVCRRVLPLASLLKLTMAFPDQAPSRLSIALRTGTVRQLRKWSDGLDAEPTDMTAAEGAERVLTLAAALNAHDHRTRGHSERVRALTDLVAERMGLDQHDADRLRWAALLHDIGKLAVPAEILNKPKAPDRREWDILRRHPEEGARLVGPLAAWLGPWASAVDGHHEKYDGTGYPRGLAGHEIPLAGRIVAVTDAFETMTAVRSYKRAMSFGEARSELQRSAGTHFDPAIVRVMYDISLPRLMGALGPLAALGHIPVIALLAQGSSVVPVLGEAAKTAALAGAASVAFTGVVALEAGPSPVVGTAVTIAAPAAVAAPPIAPVAPPSNLPSRPRSAPRATAPPATAPPVTTAPQYLAASPGAESQATPTIVLYSADQAATTTLVPTTPTTSNPPKPIEPLKPPKPTAPPPTPKPPKPEPSTTVPVVTPTVTTIPPTDPPSPDQGPGPGGHGHGDHGPGDKSGHG